jgi:putative endonuclease
MTEKAFCVYILASKPRGTLYIGVTSDLIRRVWGHKEKIIDGFTSKYNVTTLVYFEQFGDAIAAITREKRMKKWLRAWKVNLIEKENPHWVDLYTAVAGG